MSNQSLGRGLSALIPNADKPEQSRSDGRSDHSRDIVTVAISKIVSNPWQPRKSFDHEAMEDLANSIQQHGILQPLVVSPGAGDTFELIAGERRLKAAKLAGLEEVPIIIRKVEEHEKLELALVENIQRQNLNPLDEAASYQQLVNEFNLTQEEIAKRVGKSRPTIANFLRLKNLPDEIKQAIRDEEISFSHAKVILGLGTKKEQLAMMNRIIKDKIPVAQLQQEQTVVKQHTRSRRDPVLTSLEDKLTRSLGSKVNIKQSGNGGTIEINWQSEEDLKRLADKLS